MEAVESTIKAIGAVRAASYLLTDGRLASVLKELDVALDEAINQATADSEKDAA